MDGDDLTEARKSVIRPMFEKLGTNIPDVRVSLLTFDEQVHVVFLNRTHTSKTRDLTIRQTSYFSKTSSNISNFTMILSSLLNTISFENVGRDHAKKVLLLVSQFSFDIDKARMQSILNDTVKVFTIGMDFKEEAFRKMLTLSPSPFHVGTIGSLFANKVDTFLEAFVSQLSYVKCDIW